MGSHGERGPVSPKRHGPQQDTGQGNLTYRAFAPTGPWGTDDALQFYGCRRPACGEAVRWAGFRRGRSSTATARASFGRMKTSRPAGNRRFWNQPAAALRQACRREDDVPLFRAGAGRQFEDRRAPTNGVYLRLGSSSTGPDGRRERTESASPDVTAERSRGAT